jgi:hypothetical protein
VAHRQFRLAFVVAGLASLFVAAPAAAQQYRFQWLISGGGSEDDRLGQVVVGPRGEILVVGERGGPFGLGELRETAASGRHIFVARIVDRRVVSLHSGAGRDGTTRGTSVAIDGENHIWVAGTYRGQPFFGPDALPREFAEAHPDGSGFVGKLAPDGVPVRAAPLRFTPDRIARGEPHLISGARGEIFVGMAAPTTGPTGTEPGTIIARIDRASASVASTHRPTQATAQAFATYDGRPIFGGFGRRPVVRVYSFDDTSGTATLVGFTDHTAATVYALDVQPTSNDILAALYANTGVSRYDVGLVKLAGDRSGVRWQTFPVMGPNSVAPMGVASQGDGAAVVGWFFGEARIGDTAVTYDSSPSPRDVSFLVYADGSRTGTPVIFANRETASFERVHRLSRDSIVVGGTFTGELTLDGHTIRSAGGKDVWLGIAALPVGWDTIVASPRPRRRWLWGAAAASVVVIGLVAFMAMRRRG